MFRFFVSKKIDNYFLLSNEILQHIKIVRIRNEKFICTYQTFFYICILENNKAKIIKKLNKNNDYQGEITLGVSLINLKKMEFVIQKATELGVTKIIPMQTINVSENTNKNFSKKLERWKSIAKNAAEQSFRNTVPVITNISPLSDVLKLKVKHKYIAHEKDSNSVIDNFPTDSIFLIGPEGGFTADEVIEAQNQNFQSIFLGKRILRAETASLFVLSRINE